MLHSRQSILQPPYPQPLRPRLQRQQRAGLLHPDHGTSRLRRRPPPTLSSRRPHQTPTLRPLARLVHRYNVDWPLRHALLLSLSRHLLHHRHHDRNAATHAPPRRRPRTPQPAQHLSLHRRLRHAPRHAARAPPIRRRRPFHWLALHLLDLLCAAISHPHPPLLLHARLPLNQPGPFSSQSHTEEVSNAPDRHRSLDSQASCAGSSMPHWLPHLCYFHILLDDTDIPSLVPTLQLFVIGHRSFRCHWYCSHDIRSHLRKDCNGAP